MKKKFIALALAAGMALTVGLTACEGKNNGGTSDKDNDKWFESYQTVDSENYNKNLYFLNELKFEIADPTVIYVDEGEEKGYFYAYGTSDLVNCHGIQCWRSKDLTNWEYKSEAYIPNFDHAWAFSNHWAPEVLYDREAGLYFMVYNADWIARSHPNNKGGVDYEKYMDIVVSENPYGPFVSLKEPTGEPAPLFDFSTYNDQIPKELQRRDTIDAHLYIDPVSGKRYMYYSGYGTDGYGNGHGQTLFGVEMEDWQTPKYETLKELTKLYNTTTDRNDGDINEGQGVASVNEGPFMYYYEGQYFLTFSVYAYTHSMYQVRQAVATDPLGDFVKIQPYDGGQILATDEMWGTISSAGHHCFIECGDQLIIAYHTFLNRNDIHGGRALAVDTISMVKNSKGQNVMHANGPTYNYQPLPEEISGYKNVAPLATVSVNNPDEYSELSYLTDGAIKVHDSDPVQEFTTSGGTTEITLKFDKFVNARSILIYNSIYYDYAFWGINNIRLRYKKSATETAYINTGRIKLDEKWHSDEDSIIYPGATCIAEFDELPIDEIVITVIGESDKIFAFNEITVLGKEVAVARPVTKIDDYSYTNPADVVSLPVYESQTFGTAVSGDHEFKSMYGYDLEHDTGMGKEDSYVDKFWCGNLQLLYFKDVVSTDFYVEAELSVLDHTKPYNNDNYPKIGIMMKSIQNFFVFYHIDCQATYDNSVVGYVQSNYSGSDYDWNGTHVTEHVDGLNYTGDSYVKLSIARKGGTLWMFANDKLIFEVSGFRGFTDSENTASAVAFLTYNSFTRYRNYSITDKVSEVDAKLAALGVSVNG